MPFYTKKHRGVTESYNNENTKSWQNVYSQIKSEVHFGGTNIDLGSESGLYEVEIFTTHAGDLVMTAQHVERAHESFVIEIRGQDKVFNLVHKEFQGDFE